MTKASDNAFPSILIADTVDPAAPSNGFHRLFVDTDEKLKMIDHASLVTDFTPGAGGDITTDPAWAAAGDLIVATGNNAASVLTKGTDGDVLTMVSGAVAWDPPAASGGAQALPLDSYAAGSGDLFAGTSLDGGWSSLQSSALTANTRTVANWLIQTNTAANFQDRGLQRAFSPAGDFTCWAKLGYTRMVTQYQWAGMFVGATDPSDGGSGDRIEAWLLWDAANYVLKLTKVTAGTPAADTVSVAISDTGWLWGTATQSANATFPMWIGIKRVGTAVSVGWSPDGVIFHWHATTTTIAFTVNTCGLFVGGSVGSPTHETHWNHICTSTSTSL